jgi:hypothetical protein
MKLFQKVAILIIAGSVIAACKNEPIFELSPPLNLTDWSKINQFDETVMLNSTEVKCKTSSNYFTVGNDTIKTVTLQFQNNISGISEVSYKYNSSSFSNAQIELKDLLDFEVYSSRKGRLNKDSFTIDGFNFKRKYSTLTIDVIEIMNISMKYKENGKIQVFNLSNSINLKVNNSCFLVFEKGKNQPIEVEKSSWDIDVKGGSKYFPSPTILFKNDYKSPNDFILGRFDFGNLNLSNRSNIILDSKDIQYKRKGKFYNSEVGSVLSLNEYVFESSFVGTLKQVIFYDTTNQTDFVKFDSIYFQSYLMPF